MTIASDADYYAASYWQWAVALPPTAPAGTWRFEAQFNGQSKSVNFQVGATEPARFNVVEYYAPSLNHYFMTAFSDEAASLDSGTPPGWKRTGESFPAYSTGASGLATVCRFFGTPGLGVNSHFYTAFDSECTATKKLVGWTFEADAFYIATNPVQCSGNTRPVFRLYNNGMGGDPNHRYTTSWPLISDMQAEGWLLEGVAFCAPL
jgi:serine protease